MPTRAEQDELREKCTWTWTSQGGVKGYKVTSKTNGNSIFLPPAGYRQSDSLYDGYGHYNSSSLAAADNSPLYIRFFWDYVDWRRGNRHYGLPVRAVCP